MPFIPALAALLAPIGQQLVAQAPSFIVSQILGSLGASKNRKPQGYSPSQAYGVQMRPSRFDLAPRRFDPRLMSLLGSRMGGGLGGFTS